MASGKKLWRCWSNQTCAQRSRSTTIFLARFLSLHIQSKYSELIIKLNAPHAHTILLSFPLLQAVGAAPAAPNQTHANSLPKTKTHSVCKRPLGCHFQLACLPRTLISSAECRLVCLQTNAACWCLFLARFSNFFKKKLAPVECDAAQWINCCYHQRQTIQPVTPPVYSNWRQLWHLIVTDRHTYLFLASVSFYPSLLCNSSFLHAFIQFAVYVRPGRRLSNSVFYKKGSKFLKTTQKL